MKKQGVWKVGLLAIIVGIIVGIASINFQEDFPQNESASFMEVSKAVIIDQLHNDKPNESFQKNVTKYLEVGGYEVDLYTTDDITVDFYKKLPSMNYEFIVIRSHALGVGTVEESESLFTGEKYNEYKYLEEQFLGHVGKGVPYLPEQVEQLGGLEALSDQTYFVVGSRLIDEQMIGSFPSSTIVLGGCETVEGKLIADSLLQRGASEIIGWDRLVSSHDNDRIIMQVLEETLVNGVEINEAIQLVMEEQGKKITNHATLGYISSGATEL